jgi:hypothetical protein
LAVAFVRRIRMEMRRKVRHPLPTSALADLLFALLVVAIGAASIFAAVLLL